MVDISEKNFEQTIETILTQGTVVPQGGGAGHAGEAVKDKVPGIFVCPQRPPFPD